jgi:hypothetical protein
MPRVTHTYAEWRAIAGELRSPGRPPAPAGLAERVRALLREEPSHADGQAATLELDPDSADAVRAAHAALTGRDPHRRQRAAAVAEADAIVRGHQRRG